MERLLGYISQPNLLLETGILALILLYWRIHVHFQSRRFISESFGSGIRSTPLPYVLFLSFFLIATWISNLSLANTLLGGLLTLYILHDSTHLQVSSWPVVLLPSSVLIIQWSGEILGLIETTQLNPSNPIVGAPIALLAAIFAYLGWQEAAINKRSTVEEALNNRYKGRTFPDFSGHQIIHQSPKVKIDMIEVWETPSSLGKILKYFPGKKFEGTTTLRLEFLAPDETITLSDLWRPLNSHLECLSVRQYDDNKFSIMISTASIRGVDRFIQSKLMRSIPGLNDQYFTIFDPDSGRASQMVRRGASDDTPLFYDDGDLDYGKCVAGNVEYNPVSRLGYLPLTLSELKEIRRISQSDNVYTWIYPDHPEIKPEPVVIRGRADDKKFPKRLFPGIREASVPAQYQTIHPESRPERFRTALQGLEIVRRRFVDTSISQVSSREYPSGEEYETLDISISPSEGDQISKRIRFDGVGHSIPIRNFKPAEFGGTIELAEYEVDDYQGTIDDLLSSELSAKYVFSNQYDIGVIYEFEDVFPVFIWSERGGIRLAQIAQDLASALKPSIIWEAD